MKKTAPILIILSLFAILILTACGNIQEKADRIHAKALIIDTHIDTPMQLMDENYDLGQRNEPTSSGDKKVDFIKMKEGGNDASFFAVYLRQKERTNKNRTEAREVADQAIALMEKVCQENTELVEMAVTPEDAYRLEEAGKRAVFLGMENGFGIGTDLSLVEYFYSRKIRYITLCHSVNNDICDSSTDDTEWNGLSPFGEKVVREMNRLGMIIDLSHASDSTVYDVLRRTKAPVMASHSCCRNICNHPRNMSDDLLKALKKNGGVIQICLVSSFVKRSPEQDAKLDSLEQIYGSYFKVKDPAKKEIYRNAYREIRRKYPSDASVVDVVDHIDHVVKTIGVDHVGIGSDFDGGGGVIGCYDVSEFPNITIELLKRGYTEQEIIKIWGGNFMRVFREIIRVSKEIQNT